MYENQLSQGIADYINGRAGARLEKIDKEAEKKRKQHLDDDVTVRAEVEEQLREKRTEEVEKFKPANWLTDAAKRAKQISMVTHAPKFTHTDSKSSGVYFKASGKASSLLSTATLPAPRVDVIGNAAALDVASLLQLSDGESSLLSHIAEKDSSAFGVFAEGELQLKNWMDGFSEALSAKTLTSHKLAKQLYFPVVDQGYHLLAPLYASSLSQALYQRVADSRYGDVAKAIRQAKRDEKYSLSKAVDFPGIAVQTFGGTKPQNVSQLNSGRGGKSFLLSCQAPKWDTQLRPPVRGKWAFWNAYDERAWRTARSLKNYLISISDKTRTLERRDRRAEYVDELIDRLLQFAAEVRALDSVAGWSVGSDLTRSEQLWLDPHRTDREFTEQRDLGDWQQDIANQFGIWLNNKLRHKKLAVKDVEHREWKLLVEKKLALLKDDLEAMN